MSDRRRFCTYCGHQREIGTDHIPIIGGASENVCEACAACEVGRDPGVPIFHTDYGSVIARVFDTGNPEDEDEP